MKTDNESMIEDCLNRYRKLSEWESKFINNLNEKKDKNNLSDKQLEILERIWTKVT